MNKNGTVANLVASHPGNTNSLRHGIYSSTRALQPRAAELAAELMALPHAIPIDRVAAEEIAALTVRLQAIDDDLDARGHMGRSGARTLLTYRARLSAELRSWLKEFGGTPRARFEFAGRLAEVESYRRRLAGEDATP